MIKKNPVALTTPVCSKTAPEYGVPTNCGSRSGMSTTVTMEKILLERIITSSVLHLPPPSCHKGKRVTQVLIQYTVMPVK